MWKKVRSMILFLSGSQPWGQDTKICSVCDEVWFAFSCEIFAASRLLPLIMWNDLKSRTTGHHFVSDSHFCPFRLPTWSCGLAETAGWKGWEPLTFTMTKSNVRREDPIIWTSTLMSVNMPAGCGAEGEVPNVPRISTAFIFQEYICDYVRLRKLWWPLNLWSPTVLPLT